MAHSCGNRSGGSLPTQLWKSGAVFIGLETVGAVALPKLGGVGHKRKPNGRKHFSEKYPVSLARQLIWQINLYSRLPQRYFLHLAETEYLTVTSLEMFSLFCCWKDQGVKNKWHKTGEKTGVWGSI